MGHAYFLPRLELKTRLRPYVHGHVSREWTRWTWTACTHGPVSRTLPLLSLEIRCLRLARVHIEILGNPLCRLSDRPADTRAHDMWLLLPHGGGSRVAGWRVRGGTEVLAVELPVPAEDNHWQCRQAPRHQAHLAGVYTAVTAFESPVAICLLFVSIFFFVYISAPAWLHMSSRSLSVVRKAHCRLVLYRNQ